MTESARRLPNVDADGAPFWAAAAEGRLLLQQCSDCGAFRFYPKLLCPECHSDNVQWITATGNGTVHSYSVVRRAPSESFKKYVPYVVALIDLDEGVRMMSNVLAEPDEVTIGVRVKVTFRRETDEIGIPEFVLDHVGKSS